MKTKDVRIGLIVDTKVGADRRRVVVVEAIENRGSGVRWSVKDINTGRVLPKTRTAAALHPII